ncbi:MAG: hypothetical protein IT285_15165, partial [Bdellovibrionales bacterium]|nr:hypothetical protein [Bdellovibrionales bacterium]
ARQTPILAALGTVALIWSSLGAQAADLGPITPEAWLKTDPDRAVPYLTIARVRVERLPDEDLAGPAETSRDLGQDLDEADLILDKIINMGRKVWAIVEENRPVVNVSWAPADAVPAGLQGWDTLTGWQAPRAVAYRVVYENLFGIDVIDFTYRILYTPGGSYEGKGRYLTRIVALAQNLEVAWGYTFNASGTVPSVTNAGSSTAPLAAAELLVQWSIDTAVKHSQGSYSYYVRGDGTFQEL